ncbi:unnamed protein product [Musa acuminata subsp. malaccensis]|uniref:Pectinesterase n=1 Tax=Musa acuminata subsp. malaccensis TaxID=214687 RepID=A0A804IE41_MUSAM|nr:unnamed protein product [Musa acuminata subsp. malaccensis]
MDQEVVSAGQYLACHRDRILCSLPGKPRFFSPPCYSYCACLLPLIWCSLAPYSDTCTHYVSQSMQQMSIHAAMEHAILAREQILLGGLEGAARRGDVVADLVVAKDGSGDFGSIKEAINEADLMLVGDGIGKTVVTGSRSVAGGSTTFNSATVAVTGDGFIARGITFRNTAGPAKRQAVALRCNADLAVFYRCSFEGYQDTLYAHSLRQFYRECDVHGTVDFIFGNAAAVLQDCNIYVRRPMSKQQNTITAQGRTDPSQNTGIVIQHCRVTAAPDLRPVQGKFRTGGFALNTLYYGEYKNTGPGSDTSRRVRWRGHHVITDPSTALRFTVRGLLSGGSWLPATGVPFTDGL